MKINFFLVVNSKGSVKVTKTRPGLGYNEISIAVGLELPNALFSKPQLSAEIKIPNEAAAPTEITANVIEDAKMAIQQATGMEVKLTLVNEEGGNK